MIKKYKMTTVILSMLIATALTACSAHFEARKQFDESIKQYKELLSSQRFDDASLFASETLAKEFRIRAKTAKNMKVVDYRIVRAHYHEDTKKAEIEVEIDYYSLSSYVLKTLVDIQKWAYVTENGITRWRLMSLLPEFN